MEGLLETLKALFLFSDAFLFYFPPPTIVLSVHSYPKKYCYIYKKSLYSPTAINHQMLGEIKRNNSATVAAAGL